MKYGDWNKVHVDLSNVSGNREAVRDAFLESSAEEFRIGIKKEILWNEVEPKNGEFSAQEYAERIKIVREDSRSTYIGLMKGEFVSGHDMGKFALSAEYGLEDQQFMGIWRRFVDHFEAKLRTEMQRMV